MLKSDHEIDIEVYRTEFFGENWKDKLLINILLSDIVSEVNSVRRFGCPPAKNFIHYLMIFKLTF